MRPGGRGPAPGWQEDRQEMVRDRQGQRSHSRKTAKWEEEGGARQLRKDNGETRSRKKP